ncbi:WD40 repeat-like protein [Basidiobolus meristosporus CBS 931.73]|uniref:WD40 repeat-like protein n=1 Tax=Basidiobolus meristosporus CBS 931.73 TaxID=1314790 RepID=A0A1Y1YI99_9FUNG|nr:WD40 repeat-like protein [Basidiobolus meristosporus CBS 931.73]|eukprot:ORX97334.1 WD40 repeat-like protein [Basidiobolus meristosporus CBS 931.73]
MNSGELLHTLSGHTAAISSLSIGDEYLVTGGHDRFLIVWRWSTGEKVQTYCDHEHAIVGVHLRGNKIISLSKKGHFKIHDIDKGTSICNLHIHQPCGVFSALDVFEKYVVCATSATVYMFTWESREREYLDYVSCSVSHGYISCVGVHAKRVIVGCQYSRSGDSITIWDSNKLKLTNVDVRLALPICSTQVNKDVIMAGCTDGRIYLFKFSTPLANVTG